MEPSIVIDLLIIVGLPSKQFRELFYKIKFVCNSNLDGGVTEILAIHDGGYHQ